MKVVVIIPAAGLGTRMLYAPGAKGLKQLQSKQVAELGRSPILFCTPREFVASPGVNEIYIALRKSEIAQFKTRLEQEDVRAKTIHTVEGGEHRQQSVANALAAVQGDPEDVVLVHDAVRPFVTQEVIGEVISAAQKHGAAIA